MASSLVILLFSLYALFDAIALLPRVAGSILNKNGLGYTFSIMVHTLKRVFVVSYPPVLGWIALQGEGLYPTIFWSYFWGALVVALVSIFKYPIIGYFIHLIQGYAIGGSVCYAVFKHPFRLHESMASKGWVDFSFKFDQSLIYSSSCVSTLFINCVNCFSLSNGIVLSCCCQRLSAGVCISLFSGWFWAMGRFVGFGL